MKTIIHLLSVVLVAISFYMPAFPMSAFPPPLKVSATQRYVGKLESHYRIRLLVLKHCPDNIADTDARQAVQAANLAASEGLTIESIGNYHINREGQTPAKFVWGNKFYYDDLKGLQDFISEQMKLNAEPDDTFIVYTIGHGSGNGSIMRLGQREGVMRAIANAAEENNQETLWWQLSCHAGARLPAISILNEKQQSLFSMIASSPANELSYFCTQGKRMEKVFLALASNSREIDPNQDDVVTKKELADFIAKNIGQKYGDLVFAKNDAEPIFGWRGRLPNSLPIIDHSNPQREYPRNYIPMPTYR